MNFPMWGDSFLIGRAGLAVVAILFVFAAHAAAGLGTINAMLFHRSRLCNDDLIRRFLSKSSALIVIIPMIASFILLLATWFYAGLSRPEATSAIIHTFMWLLAAQSIIAVVQAAAAYMYCWNGNRITPYQRQTIAWIYAASSWGMVVIISALTSFMFTPDNWLQTYSFWDALFNPTFIPSLIIHAAWAIVLGSTCMILIVNAGSGFTPHERYDLEIISGKWLWALAITVPMLPLYLMAVPSNEGTFLYKTNPAATMYFGIGIGIAVLLAAYFFLALQWRRERIGFSTSIMLAILLILATGSFDMAQAKIRAPYTIAGYIYTNGLTAQDKLRLDREGLLDYSHWIVPRGADLIRVPPWKRGKWVFETLGYSRYLGQDAEGIREKLKAISTNDKEGYIRHLRIIDPTVPPFQGSERDLKDLIQYIERGGEE